MLLSFPVFFTIFLNSFMHSLLNVCERVCVSKCACVRVCPFHRKLSVWSLFISFCWVSCVAYTHVFSRAGAFLQQKHLKQAHKEQKLGKELQLQQHGFLRRQVLQDSMPTCFRLLQNVLIRGAQICRK